MKRVIWVDYAKIIAIFLVVWLHVHSTWFVTEIINGFIMPLFFLLSGILFSYERNPSYQGFIRKRFRQLVVPYLWIGVLSYVLWLLLLRHFGTNENDLVHWSVPLIGLVAGVPSMLICNIPIWSLLSFFVVECIFYPLGRMKRAGIIIPVVSLLILVVSDYWLDLPLDRFPLVIGPSIAGLFFYSLGNTIASNVAEFGKYNNVYYAVLFIVCLGILMLALKNNDNIDFYICNYSNFWWYLVSSMSGAACVIIISIILSRLGEGRFVKFISESTLIICGFHLLVFSFVKGLAYYAFGIEPTKITDGFLPGLCFALISFLLTLPICYVIRHWFRFLVDK